MPASSLDTWKRTQTLISQYYLKNNITHITSNRITIDNHLVWVIYFNICPHSIGFIHASTSYRSQYITAILTLRGNTRVTDYNLVLLSLSTSNHVGCKIQLPHSANKESLHKHRKTDTAPFAHTFLKYRPIGCIFFSWWSEIKWHFLLFNETNYGSYSSIWRTV